MDNAYVGDIERRIDYVFESLKQYEESTKLLKQEKMVWANEYLPK